ncbi:MAG: amidase [Rhizobiales bacterium]|nr:amidase [Hyphomicrobiales bacterium]
MAEAQLIAMSANEIVRLLKAGDVSPLDLLDALEQRCAQVDGAVNALPTRDFERARAAARALLRKPVAERGLLAGMPVPIKDLTNVAGMRSTMGSPIFADVVPKISDVLVTHLEAEGALIYAKSNTPEFGAGANTFNEVFGATRNPWNTALSAAGSSGGAAVSLATGMAWLAHGSDMGGSLRNPASFCGIVGMRPTPGRVAHSLTVKVDATLGVQGPMARTVEDCALLLDAMCGEEATDPLSKPRPATSFLAATRAGWRPKRVAYSPDLGVTPVDRRVVEITRRAAHRLAEAGVIVEEAHPDLREAHEAFQTLRALSFATSLSTLLRNHRDKLKPEVIWNIEKGLALTADDIVRAEHQRTVMSNRALAFFETYDLLLCPTTIVPPFPVEERYVKAVEGHVFDNYVEWLAIVYAITLISGASVSVPAGFTGDGLPVGLQVVAPANCDARALAGAKLLEDVLDLNTLRPIDPRAPAA